MFFNPVFIFVGLKVTPEMPETPAFPREQMLRLRHVPFFFCRYHARACRTFQGEKEETKCVVQGGDWGSVTAQSMAMMYPKSVTGIHLTFFATLSLSGMLRMAIYMARPRIK